MALFNCPNPQLNSNSNLCNCCPNISDPRVSLNTQTFALSKQFKPHWPTSTKEIYANLASIIRIMLKATGNDIIIRKERRKMNEKGKMVTHMRDGHFSHPDSWRKSEKPKYTKGLYLPTNSIKYPPT